jgi:hypothetical protein
MRVAITSLPQYAFMVWCLVSTGKTLPLQRNIIMTVQNVFVL